MTRDAIRSPAFWERYDQFRSPSTSIGITNYSFQRYRLSNPSGDIDTRSMLTSYEIALLYALARDYFRGTGVIVDLGVLNGVSTNALARGLRANTASAETRRKIFSFDLFRTEGLPGEFFEGSQDVTGCFLDTFIDNNRDYLDLISLTAGDIRSFRWERDRKIEILFNDVSKSWELNRWIQRNVFPALVPGESVVVQQDYIYFHSYWVAITMEYYGDYFEPLYPVFGSSMVYRYARQLPDEAFDRDLESLPLDIKLELLDRAIAAALPSVGEVLKCAKAYCLVDNGHPDAARSVLESVSEASAGGDPLYDYSSIAASKKATVGRLIR
jgi:hypothetical protein